MEPNERVIIIGAGIGGLTLAHALRLQGMEPVIYEQSPSLRRVGAGLTLWQNAIYVLDRLGLARQVIQSGSPFRHALIDTWDGQRLIESHLNRLEAKMGLPALGIHRAALHQVLLSGLPSECVCLDKKLVDVRQDAKVVTAIFADGSQDHARLLVGADGIHSTVRGKIFPPVRIRYAGYAAWRGVARISEIGRETYFLPSATVAESWGLGMRFGMVWIGPGEIYWFASENTLPGRSMDPTAQKEYLLRRFGKWHAPIPALIDRTPADEILYNDILDFRPLPGWSSDRIVLLGDAAHATTPNMGQGACQAIESAAVLARELARCSRPEEALQAYQRARRSRTATITARSWQIGRLGQVSHPLLYAARNVLMRALSFASSSGLENSARFRAI